MFVTNPLSSGPYTPPMLRVAQPSGLPLIPQWTGKRSGIAYQLECRYHAAIARMISGPIKNSHPPGSDNRRISSEALRMGSDGAAKARARRLARIQDHMHPINSIKAPAAMAHPGLGQGTSSAVAMASSVMAAIEAR